METLMTTPATCVVTGGEDTAHLSYHCRLTAAFQARMPELRAAKECAKQPVQRAHETDDAPQPVVVVGEHTYVVRASGFAPDKDNARYCYYEFVLVDGGLVIAIQPREPRRKDGKVSKTERPNVRVEIGAMPLIVAGSLESLMPSVEARLEALGMEVLKNSLARVDACVDVPVSVRGLQHALIDRRFKTRARSMSAYVIFDDDGEERASILPSEFPDDAGYTALHFRGMSCTGFSVGKDKIMCRGYDKLEKEKHREEMLEALRLRRFGEDAELPGHLMRVEFQLRRDALRGMTIVGEKAGIETWQDWVAYKAVIVRYLCTEWLVFTDRDFDRTHSARLVMGDWHKDWLTVVSAFKRAYGESGKSVVRLQGSIKREGEAALAQSIGNDQSAMMKVGAHLSPNDPEWMEKLAAFRYHSTFRYLSTPERRIAFWDNWDDKELRQEASLPDELLSAVLPVASREAGVTHPQSLSTLLHALVDGAGLAGARHDAIH